MLAYEWLVLGKALRTGDNRDKTQENPLPDWATLSVPQADKGCSSFVYSGVLSPLYFKVTCMVAFPPLLVKLFHDLMKKIVMKSFHRVRHVSLYRSKSFSTTKAYRNTLF